MRSLQNKNVKSVALSHLRTQCLTKFLKLVVTVPGGIRQIRFTAPLRECAASPRHSDQFCIDGSRLLEQNSRAFMAGKKGDLDSFILTQSPQKKNDMGDRGQEAIHAAGRIIEPECRASISQLFVSSCSTVPTRRVLSVAAVMDVAWTILQSPPCGEQPAEIDDVDAARAQEYALLAMLLARTPDAATLGRITKLRGDATPLGRAHEILAQAAVNASAEKIQREFFNLFIGIERGELLPYASYYVTGLRNERPRVRLSADLRGRGIERAKGQVEAEDHAAVLCEIMAELAGGPSATAARLQQQFFQKHLASWIGRFFADLEKADSADFYRHAGAVGRLFMEIETNTFALPA
jgi:TorA maturation chaperone TorD